MACSSTVGVMWRVLAELKREFHVSDALPTNMKEICCAFQTWPARCASQSKCRVVLIFDDVEMLDRGWRPHAVVGALTSAPKLGSADAKTSNWYVSAGLVNSIPIELHPDVRVIACMTTFCSAFDATTTPRGEPPLTWKQSRLPRAHYLADTPSFVRRVIVMHRRAYAYGRGLDDGPGKTEKKRGGGDDSKSGAGVGDGDGDGNDRDEDIVKTILRHSSKSDPITLHGLRALLFTQLPKSTDGSANGRDLSGKAEADAAVPSAVPEQPAGFEDLCKDEKLTWEALRALCVAHPLAELFLCLMLITRRGVTEVEVLECFRLASEQGAHTQQQEILKTRKKRARSKRRKSPPRAGASPRASPRAASAAGSPNQSPRAGDASPTRPPPRRSQGHVPVQWIISRPLSAWIALRKIVAPYFARVVCGRWTMVNAFVRSVAARCLLPLAGFRFYGGLLVHVISTGPAEARAAEELPHLLYCALDSNHTQEAFLSPSLADKHAQASRKRQKYHLHRQQRQAREQIAADKQRLVDCIVQAPQLYFLTARQNLPLLGMYCHGLRGHFNGIDIALSACRSMNEALGTTPVLPEELPPPPALSQMRRPKKKEPVPFWDKHIDTHLLLQIAAGSRLRKALARGKTQSSQQQQQQQQSQRSAASSPHVHVMAVGKLMILMNLCAPAASLLRVSLLMNMERISFEMQPKKKRGDDAPFFLDKILAVETLSAWVRAATLDWKQRRLLKENAGRAAAVALCVEVLGAVKDMEKALDALQSFGAGSWHATDAHELRLAGKRIDRLVVEAAEGKTVASSLDTRSAYVLREVAGAEDRRVRVEAAEWHNFAMFEHEGAGRVGAEVTRAFVLQ